MSNRIDEIHGKGFNISTNPTNGGVPVDYSKLRLGAKVLEDATLNVGELTRLNDRLAKKENVLKAIETGDLATMVEISNYFVRLSGIYRRLCKHMSNFYRYDWLITPHKKKRNNAADKQIMEAFYNELEFLDNFQIKKFLGETAYSVIVNGCYYGFIIHNDDSAQVQELPTKYCRSRFKINGKPTVEFNMKYFVDAFKDIPYRHRVLSMFPKDFQKGY